MPKTREISVIFRRYKQLRTLHVNYANETGFPRLTRMLRRRHVFDFHRKFIWFSFGHSTSQRSDKPGAIRYSCLENSLFIYKKHRRPQLCRGKLSAYHSPRNIIFASSITLSLTFQASQFPYFPIFTIVIIQVSAVSRRFCLPPHFPEQLLSASVFSMLKVVVFKCHRSYSSYGVLLFLTLYHNINRGFL